MAGLSFNNVKGSGKSAKVDHYKMKDGENRVRLFGAILPRYVYWVPGTNDKNIPFECLEFNRETETFDRAEKDWVKEFFPDLKAGWAYSMMCLDPEGKAVVFDFKSKLFQQIMTAAQDLGDPADPETGWDLVFTRKKTGPLAFNVEYTLNPIRCQKLVGPLTDEQRATIEASKTIDELVPRATPDQQKTQLERILKPEGEDAVDEETAADLGLT